MPGAAEVWIEGHKQEAGMVAGGVAVLVLAFAHKRKTAAAASASTATTDTAGAPAAAAADSSGDIGIPGTTETDVQNAVQDQVNSDLAAFQAQTNTTIAGIPRGATGATGKTGATGAAGAAPAMWRYNLNELQHGRLPISVAEYRSLYPHGQVETASQAAYIKAHTPAPKKAAPKKAAPKPVKAAPKPKPKPTPHKVVVAPKVVAKK